MSFSLTPTSGATRGTRIWRWNICSRKNGMRTSHWQLRHWMQKLRTTERMSDLHWEIIWSNATIQFWSFCNYSFKYLWLDRPPAHRTRLRWCSSATTACTSPTEIVSHLCLLLKWIEFEISSKYFQSRERAFGVDTMIKQLVEICLWQFCL